VYLFLDGDEDETKFILVGYGDDNEFIFYGCGWDSQTCTCLVGYLTLTTNEVNS